MENSDMHYTDTKEMIRNVPVHTFAKKEEFGFSIKFHKHL